MMAAKRRGYELAAVLRARRSHSPPPTTLVAHIAEYEALVEYAAALEAENLELKSVGGVTCQQSATPLTPPRASPPH